MSGDDHDPCGWCHGTGWVNGVIGDPCSACPSGGDQPCPSCGTTEPHDLDGGHGMLGCPIPVSSAWCACHPKPQSPCPDCGYQPDTPNHVHGCGYCFACGESEADHKISGCQCPHHNVYELSPSGGT